MGLFSKKFEPNSPRIEPLPVISDTDLANATRVMDRWDASMGNSNAMWDTLIGVGRVGGYKGGQAQLMEYMDTQRGGGDTDLIFQRPWRWWNEAARAANTCGDFVLPGRIFLFLHFFVREIQPHMNVGNEQENGLPKPQEQYYKDIAALAVDSMSELDPGYLIHNTSTGQVDVAQAILWASEVSGVNAPVHDSALGIEEPSP